MSCNETMIPKTWVATIEDAGDGSGDGIVTLPDGVLEALGWDEETELECAVLDDGSIEIRPV